MSERVEQFRRKLAAIRAESPEMRAMRLSNAIDCVMKCEAGMSRALETLTPNHPAYQELRLLVALCQATSKTTEPTTTATELRIV